MQGVVATILTQPVDVLKTRMMNAQPGQYKVKYKIPVLLIAYVIFLFLLIEHI